MDIDSFEGPALAKVMASRSPLHPGQTLLKLIQTYPAKAERVDSTWRDFGEGVGVPSHVEALDSSKLVEIGPIVSQSDGQILSWDVLTPRPGTFLLELVFDMRADQVVSFHYEDAWLVEIMPKKGLQILGNLIQSRLVTSPSYVQLCLRTSIAVLSQALDFTVRLGCSIQVEAGKSGFLYPNFRVNLSGYSRVVSSQRSTSSLCSEMAISWPHSESDELD